MSPFHFRRNAALGVSLVLALSCLSLPASANTPVTVSFPANSVWAQEIGNVSHSDNSQDYTVAIEAGNTVKINLITRNPNVNFKVMDQTHDKQLLDSHKTGVSTWSAPNPTATTYTVRVYIDPGVIDAGEEVKYALQIGQYGDKDLRSPATEVKFQDGNPWVQENGIFDAGSDSHKFTVSIAAGKTLSVYLTTGNPQQLHFKVDDQTAGKTLVDTGTTGATAWSAPVAIATTYLIQVYGDPAALPSGQKAPYALQIGQVEAVAAPPANPAGATSAAMPGATSPMPQP